MKLLFRQPELKKMFDLLKPTIAVPVHGEPVHLHEHVRLAKSWGAKHAIEVENGVPFLRNRGITHGFQAAGMIAPLPFEEIAATKAMLGIKDQAGHFTLRNGIPSLFDGMHRNYFMRAVTDTWAASKSK